MVNRIICMFLLITFGVSMNTPFFDLNQYFSSGESVVIYNDGDNHICNNKEKDDIVIAFNSMLKDSHEMPAFGVSLDTETRAALKSGTWVEFNYPSTQYYNDMPFDSLLIKVVAEDMGFNIIRKHNGLYEGRCYYISLSNNMSTLSEVIDNIIK